MRYPGIPFDIPEAPTPRLSQGPFGGAKFVSEQDAYSFNIAYAEWQKDLAALCEQHGFEATFIHDMVTISPKPKARPEPS